MCKSEIGSYSRSGLRAAIAIFEERTGMPSAEFEQRFSEGELEGFYYNVWHQLLGELGDLSAPEDAADENLIAEVRQMNPERAVA